MLKELNKIVEPTSPITVAQQVCGLTVKQMFAQQRPQADPQNPPVLQLQSLKLDDADETTDIETNIGNEQFQLSPVRRERTKSEDCLSFIIGFLDKKIRIRNKSQELCTCENTQQKL